MEILLITSRGSGRWIIPKGKPIPDLAPHEAAGREAYEEAGLLGRVAPTSLGRFAYIKDQAQSRERFIPAVEVFPMEVTGQLTLWPEMGQRRVLWFDPEDAIAHIELEPLREIVRRFVIHISEH
ncbi:hypothetical protein AEYBE204_10465 [Asticcacaulis sp. YBE204]|nr:hypothetical protein AEYBE204_10465 [Asticcacaulis sp. YBE204]